MHYMLDTNICIYLLKQHPPQVLKRMRDLRRGDAVMSVVTYAELRAGIELQVDQRQQDAHVLGLFRQRVPVLALDETAAEQFGVLRAAVRARNRNALDRLIAAHAISIGATLVTNNEADFAGYANLTLENWAAPA